MNWLVIAVVLCFQLWSYGLLKYVLSTLSIHMCNNINNFWKTLYKVAGNIFLAIFLTRFSDWSFLGSSNCINMAANFAFLNNTVLFSVHICINSFQWGCIRNCLKKLAFWSKYKKLTLKALPKRENYDTFACNVNLANVT